MYAVILDQHGVLVEKYKLEDEDPLCCDVYAERFSEQIGYELERAYNMPTGADYEVILQEEVGSVICWKSATYLIGE